MRGVDLQTRLNSQRGYRNHQGLMGTPAGQHRFVRTERYQETPAGGMGKVPIYDRVFAETNGDIAFHGNFNALTAAGRWNPLLANPTLVRKRKDQLFQYKFLTPNGQIEDMRLHRSQLVRAPPAQAFTIPIHQ